MLPYLGSPNASTTTNPVLQTKLSTFRRLTPQKNPSFQELEPPSPMKSPRIPFVKLFQKTLLIFRTSLEELDVVCVRRRSFNILVQNTVDSWVYRSFEPFYRKTAIQVAVIFDFHDEFTQLSHAIFPSNPCTQTLCHRYLRFLLSQTFWLHQKQVS